MAINVWKKFSFKMTNQNIKTCVPSTTHVSEVAGGCSSKYKENTNGWTYVCVFLWALALAVHNVESMAVPMTETVSVIKDSTATIRCRINGTVLPRWQVPPSNDNLNIQGQKEFNNELRCVKEHRLRWDMNLRDLTIIQVDTSDAGMYRCHVDTRSNDYNVNLLVVERIHENSGEVKFGGDTIAEKINNGSTRELLDYVAPFAMVLTMLVIAGLLIGSFMTRNCKPEQAKNETTTVTGKIQEIVKAEVLENLITDEKPK